MYNPAPERGQSDKKEIETVIETETEIETEIEIEIEIAMDGKKRPKVRELANQHNRAMCVIQHLIAHASYQHPL